MTPEIRIKEIITEHINEIDDNNFADLYMAMPNNWHSRCTNLLHSVGIFPENYLVHIPIGFQSITPKLTKLVIPSNIKTIGGEAFRSCYNLYNVDLGQISVIGTKAFKGCTALIKVIIPKTVTIIASEAFADTGLKILEYEGTKEDWSKIDISYTAFLKTGLDYVKCKDGELEL